MSTDERVIGALMDVAEVAYLLKCSKLTVYRRCKCNCFPYMKNGRRMLFRKSDITSWLDALRSNSMDVGHKARGESMETKREIEADIVKWVCEMLKTKQFGSFGIQVKMHEGIPVNVEKTNAVSYQKKIEGIVRVP